MTTRSRARSLRAAAWTALAGATLAGTTLTPVATPATAAPPAIRIESVSSDNVTSGQSVRVRFRATNNDRRATQRAFVAVSGGLKCTAGCSAIKDLGPGQSASFSATVVAPEVNENEQSGLNLAVTVRIGLQTGFAHKMILVRGASTPSATMLTQVSGRVRDDAGRAVGNASVTVKDGAGHTYRTSSDGDGRFAIRSSDSRPIAAGPITVAASKNGYRTGRAKVQGKAGGAASVRLTLAVVAAPSKAPPSASAVASAPVVAEAPVTGATSAEATPLGTLKASGGQGDGPLLFSILGGLLVAVGLGALVMMVIRRRGAPEPPVDVPAPPAGPVRMADAPTALLSAVPPDVR